MCGKLFNLTSNFLKYYFCVRNRQTWASTQSVIPITTNERSSQLVYTEYRTHAIRNPPDLLNQSNRSNTYHAKIDYKNFSRVVNVFKSSRSRVSALEEPECLICFLPLQANRMWVELPCGHIFHSRCAKRWICKHSQAQNCPKCRTPVR